MAVDLKMASVLKDPGTRVVICCGAGGVGKTTTAAAMALYAAEQGRRVAVLTIDPARRLAQSLGMTALTNEPQPVPLDCAGSLDAMMLDMRRTFDDMVMEHSTPDRAAAIWRTPSIRPSHRRSRVRRSTWRWRSSASCSPRTAGT